MSELNLYSFHSVPTAQTSGTTSPPPPSDAGGSDLTPVILGVAVVLLLALIVVAVRSFWPSRGESSPRVRSWGDGARPGQDLLGSRDEVDEHSEIEDSDSLSEVKRKKRERVTGLGSYEEAREALQDRKSDRVREEQQRRLDRSRDAEETDGDGGASKAFSHGLKAIDAGWGEMDAGDLPVALVGLAEAQGDDGPSTPGGTDLPSGAADDEPKSLAEGLEKTRGGFVKRLGALFARKQQIDTELLDELEEVLYTADMGPKSVEALLARVRSELDEAEISDPARVWEFLREETESILRARERPREISSGPGPHVILVIGVNGVGKTTTIGKLAMRYTDAGQSVLMVAGDTFRAAATEQLEEWGERTGLAVHVGKDKEDPASVVFAGVQRAQEEGIDIVLCDTAGRLTNKKNLMKELEKIGRVAGKASEGAPHETLLVLDANTGMMAVHQARMFQEVVDVSGIVLTKLDGTAKGGVIIGISEELDVPVCYIGIGEGVYDLRPFDAGEFVEALFA
jgi:fused signal recognition particle receptor